MNNQNNNQKIQNLIINSMPQYEAMLEFTETGKHSLEMSLKAIISPSAVKESLRYMSEYMTKYGFHIKMSLIGEKTFKITHF